MRFPSPAVERAGGFRWRPLDGRRRTDNRCGFRARGGFRRWLVTAFQSYDETNPDGGEQHHADRTKSDFQDGPHDPSPVGARALACSTDARNGAGPCDTAQGLRKTCMARSPVAGDRLNLRDATGKSAGLLGRSPWSVEGGTSEADPVRGWPLKFLGRESIRNPTAAKRPRSREVPIRMDCRRLQTCPLSGPQELGNTLPDELVRSFRAGRKQRTWVLHISRDWLPDRRTADGHADRELARS